MNTVQIGDIGEAFAIAKFTKAGFTVSNPIANNARYDLIVDINNRLYRVQVKTLQKVTEEVKMEFYTKTTNYTKGKWKSNRYTDSEIEMLFLYCLENDWCGLYLVEGECPSQITVRLSPPKNNQKIGINMAEDFEFNTQINALVA